MTLRLALPLIGRGAWTGGLNYLKTTLNVLTNRLSGEIEPVVMLSPAEAAKVGETLSGSGARIVVDHAMAGAGRGKSLATALAWGHDPAVSRLYARERIDVAFEVAAFHGWRPPHRVLAWLPDLQHRVMPEMFSAANWWRRDIGFQLQTRLADAVMVSSEAARDDVQRFYPAAAPRLKVVRFAAPVDIAAARGRIAAARAAHGLPERFLYLPNQGWKHKNHAVVVAALERLRAEGRLDALPPIILSGLTEDPRHPGEFEALMTRAAEKGLSAHLRHLGLIPFADVMALVAGCERLVNPSLFEGWSTPIEEAKALGAPLLLSDLPIHREQAPDAVFFPPEEPAALAETLVQLAADPPPPRPPLDALLAAREARLAAHATALADAVRAATR